MIIDRFLDWFYEFMSTMLGSLWQIVSNFFYGVVGVFNLPKYIGITGQYKNSFTALEWILTIVSFILTYAVVLGIVALIVLLIRKYVRFRKTLVGNEDLLEEIAECHRDVLRLTMEKEKILAMKAGAGALVGAGDTFNITENNNTEKPEEKKDAQPTGSRFYRLTLVDEKYAEYVPPVYDASMSLSELCEDLRNFACSNAKLYYEIRTIRLMIAGLASTKMVILQGISGTGKTSLPYIMGKYFINDTTIAPVQPSWRDRTELFGFFNEFTKRFNETEVLRRIYEAGYQDDVNIIILDEMNISRIEYYFAEMLSILEMPDHNEWKLEIVPSSWPNDPKRLERGLLKIPENVWYVGTANNDDSTFAISDKVYDRAFVINLDSKGMPFRAPETSAKKVAYSYIESLYKKAQTETPISQETLDKIEQLDLYVIEHFRVAFGNRILKQLKLFSPVYVACGGTELDAVDYLLMTKVFRKFEALNLSLIRDEIKGLIAYMDTLFGRGMMKECTAYLLRLEKTY